jgi:hypothetical protein
MLLRLQGLTKPQIKEALKVPSQEAKNCDRAFKELKELKVVTKDENMECGMLIGTNLLKLGRDAYWFAKTWAYGSS